MSDVVLAEPLEPNVQPTIRGIVNLAGDLMIYAFAKLEQAEPGAHAIIANEMQKGGRMRLVVDMNPHVISVQVLQADGNSEQIFAFHLTDDNRPLGSKPALKN